MSDPLIDRPVFIGGPHRSGTGMLRAILGSNSQLAVPVKEYQFFDRLSPSGDAVRDLRAVLGWPKVREWQLPAVDAAAMLTGTDGSLKEIYAAPLRAHAAALGKPRFGEKTPYLERHFETLRGWFGAETRFVQIVRAPLPTFVSLSHMEGSRRAVNPVIFARGWRASALRGLDFAACFPGQFTLIPYESFVADPAAWTRRLCEFCGLPPEIDTMLATMDGERRRNSSFVGDDWRPGIAPIDRRLIEREVGPLIDGVEPFLGGPAPLPLALIAEENRRDTPLLARMRTLSVRVRAKLP
ncbi:sulfotransferase [Sphingomonas sp.]|uniref:sulfotransferase family protein n=1 Tax=Sphingomonas sp. TaxID=28214 RepID=UPI0025F7AA91|nr:sulfotransferase [Sphingomonas sp.]